MMRVSIDMDRVRAAAAAAIPDGVGAARFVKKRVLGGALRQLDKIDPEVAAGLLAAQRSFFAAGKAFFDEEMKHAERAEAKFRAKAQAAKHPAPPEPAAPAPEPQERVDDARPD
ncbi:MAG: hypothetical protein SF028_15725 [Candidatus Sumerlaeia bacterium]|nr:hypothetical protein [Candidatus Sumerlaeia bacterium]